MEIFDPKVHICKFGFELFDHASSDHVRYNMIGNLYEKEIVFEFIDKKTEEIVDVIGYRISEDKMQSLLKIVYWNDYEKYRDLPDGWAWEDVNGHAGYRDGWGYKFWCLSESGLPLLQVYMSCIFVDDKLPSYEKLLKWLRDNYSKKKELKDKHMLW